MGKNILVLAGSPRKNGNSDILCDQFIKGAEEKGNKAEKVYVADLKINYCTGCEVCHTTGKCIHEDDMPFMFEKLLKADVIVFATPVYFYSMSAQLKTFIDRLVPVYTQLRGKEVYIFLTAWDSEKNNLKSTLEAIRGLTRDCMEETIERGVIFGVGAEQKGDIKRLATYEEAYLMGKEV